MPFNGAWNVLLKAVCIPAAFSVSAYLAYRRFIHVPEPFVRTLFQRQHRVIGNRPIFSKSTIEHSSSGGIQGG